MWTFQTLMRIVIKADVNDDEEDDDDKDSETDDEDDEDEDDTWFRSIHYSAFSINDHVALDRNPGLGYDTLLLRLIPRYL